MASQRRTPIIIGLALTTFVLGALIFTTHYHDEEGWYVKKIPQYLSNNADPEHNDDLDLGITHPHRPPVPEVVAPSAFEDIYNSTLGVFYLANFRINTLMQTSFKRSSFYQCQIEGTNGM